MKAGLLAGMTQMAGNLVDSSAGVTGLGPHFFLLAGLHSTPPHGLAKYVTGHSHSPVVSGVVGFLTWQQTSQEKKRKLSGFKKMAQDWYTMNSCCILWIKANHKGQPSFQGRRTRWVRMPYLSGGKRGVGLWAAIFEDYHVVALKDLYIWMYLVLGI